MPRYLFLSTRPPPALRALQSVLPESVLTHSQTRPPRRIPQHLIPSVVRKNGEWLLSAIHTSNNGHANAEHRRNQGTFTATRSLNRLRFSPQPSPTGGSPANSPQLTLTPQCLRRSRVHHCLQRPQARQEHQVDHLQDFRRLQGDRCRGVFHRGQLRGFPGEAGQRQEQQQEGRVRYWRPLRRVRRGVRQGRGYAQQDHFHQLGAR